MSFSPYGHGMSCYHCEDCGCIFGVDCLDDVGDNSCPRCGGENVVRTGERLIGKTVKEYNSVEEYEKTLKK